MKYRTYRKFYNVSRSLLVSCFVVAMIFSFFGTALQAAFVIPFKTVDIIVISYVFVYFFKMVTEQIEPYMMNALFEEKEADYQKQAEDRRMVEELEQEIIRLHSKDENQTNHRRNYNGYQNI